MKIRHTTETDEPALRTVHEAAFGPQAGRVVADLAIELLHDPTATPLLSLAACEERRTVGHVLFTSVGVSVATERVCARILAPLAVLPERQRQGVGTALVKTGLAELAASGCELVFVLGHPEYYPRFGFQPAGRLGLSAPYPIPAKHSDAWMVKELREGKLGSVRGQVQCAAALNKPEHWRE